MSSPAYRARVAYSKVALGVHLTTAVTLSAIASAAHQSVHNGALLTLLMAQEWVALGGAAVALVRLWWSGSENFFNTTKWAEYSVSATLGVFVVYTSGDSDSEAWVVLVLIFLSSTQQILGRILDEAQYTAKAALQFLLAWGFQVTEFWVVAATASSLRVAPFSVYVLMWSSFGVLCGARLAATRRLEPSWLGERWASELLYTTLGWTAKLALVLTTVPFVFGTDDPETTASWVMAAVSVSGAAAAVYYTQLSASKLYAGDSDPIVPPPANDADVPQLNLVDFT